MDNLTLATGIADKKTVTEKHQTNQEPVKSGIRKAQFHPLKAREQPLPDSTLSELSLSMRHVKLASLTNTHYETTDYYQEQAFKTIVELHQAVGAPTVAPKFIETECPMEEGFPLLQQLKTTSDGLKMLGLANALQELLVVTKKVKGHNTNNTLIFCNGIYRFSSYPFNFNEVTSRLIFFRRFRKVLHEIMDIRHVELFKDFTNFDCWRLSEWMQHLSGSPYNYCLESCQFIVKLLSYCILNSIDIKLNRKIYLDVNLAIFAIKNPYVFLYLKPEKIRRWLFSLDQARAIKLDDLIIENVLIKNSTANILNNFFWSHEKGEYINGDNEILSIEMLEHYETDCFIPYTICDLLFTSCSPQASMKSCDEGPITLDGKNLFSKENLRIGEELEYWICDSDKTSSRSLKISDSDAKHILRRWRIRTIRLLREMNVKFERPSIDYNELNLDYSIGSWQAKVFRDFDVIEIITTPYKMNEQFVLETNNETVRWDFYKMSDAFIHPIAKALEFKGCSGHKHIDLIPAFNGNPELLFRVIIDTENTTWLPRALGREAKTGFFPYVVQDELKYKRLCSMVAGVNKYLVSGNGLPRLGKFANILKLKEFLDVFDMNQKLSPCALHHLRDAHHTSDINITPSSTMELRVLNCPDSGENSLLLNNFLIARFEYLVGCQKRREPLTYKPVHPYFYRNDRDKEVVEAFAQYIGEMGREPIEFMTLLKIQTPTECMHLFEPTSDRQSSSVDRTF